MCTIYKVLGLVLFIYITSFFTSVSYLLASDTSIREQIDYLNSQKIGDSKISSLIMSSDIIRNRKYDINNLFIKINSSNHIEVYLYVEYLNDVIIKELENNGFISEIINKEHNIIQGWMHMDDLIKISNLRYVLKIKPPVYGILRQGSKTTEGDMVLNSDVVREELGITGKGIKVGVISDGIDSLSISQSTGDLPDNVCVIRSGNGDEGTALLETVHDIAPEAELSFSEGFSSSLAFMRSVDNLINICDVDIIVDDVGFLLEPYFQDGSVAQKIDDAVSKGVIFVTAAGNSADEHYQHLYFDENVSDAELNIHDFGQADGRMSDLSMPLLVGGNQFAPNNFIAVILQWNDPFGLSNNDYDLFLFDENSNLLDSSTAIQNGNDDPVEVVVFENNSDQIQTLNLIINKFSGESKVLEFNFNGVISVEDYNVSEDSMFGHPAAQGAISVAAVPYFEPDMIEEYSSRGPVSIIAGNNTVLNNADMFTDLKASNDFELRQKPDITGVDGTSTSLPGFTPFFGTSVAAPHVAGVLALILDASPSLLIPSTGITSSTSIRRSVNDIESIIEILRDTSIDLGEPGIDTTYGFGRIDALAAVEEALNRFGGDDGDNGGMEEPPDNVGPSDDNDMGSSNGGCSMTGYDPGIQNSLFNLCLIIIAMLSVVWVRTIRNYL